MSLFSDTSLFNNFCILTTADFLSLSVFALFTKNTSLSLFFIKWFLWFLGNISDNFSFLTQAGGWETTVTDRDYKESTKQHQYQYTRLVRKSKYSFYVYYLLLYISFPKDGFVIKIWKLNGTDWQRTFSLHQRCHGPMYCKISKLTFAGACNTGLILCKC